MFIYFFINFILGHLRMKRSYIFTTYKIEKKSSVLGLNFFPQLTLTPTGTFCKFLSAIENLSPPTAGKPMILTYRNKTRQ